MCACVRVSACICAVYVRGIYLYLYGTEKRSQDGSSMDIRSGVTAYWARVLDAGSPTWCSKSLQGDRLVEARGECTLTY